MIISKITILASKTGADVNSVMRDLMSVLPEDSLDNPIQSGKPPYDLAKPYFLAKLPALNLKMIKTRHINDKTRKKAVPAAFSCILTISDSLLKTRVSYEQLRFFRQLQGIQLIGIFSCPLLCLLVESIISIVSDITSDFLDKQVEKRG